MIYKNKIIKTILKYKVILYNALENKSNHDALSEKINSYVTGIIIISVFLGAISTVRNIYNNYSTFFILIDYLIFGFFVTEYVTRVYIINVSEKFKGVIKGRLKYMLTPMALLDFFIIIISCFVLDSTHIFTLRLIRLLKVARLFQAVTQTHTFGILKVVIDKEKQILKLIFVFCMVLVLASSSLIYILEHNVQPEVFSSIPQAMWWSIVTFTTVGYGDMYPVTTLGRLLTSFIALVGLASFSVPTTILTAGIISETQKEKREKKKEVKCTHCGKVINTDD